MILPRSAIFRDDLSTASPPVPRHSPAALLVFCLLASGATGAEGSSQKTRDDAIPPPSATAPASSPFESAASPAPRGEIDRTVFAHWLRQGIEPARVCSDAVFVRRAHLDIIGTLPTAAEARQFIQDGRPEKRIALIDRLLEREEFADYWAMKWSDLLRVKAEFPINLWPNAAQAYHRWIHTAVRDNLPYDKFAHALLTANGSNFRHGPANFHRAAQGRTPDAIARVAALTFMGARTEKWSDRQREDFAVFFSRIGYKGTAEWKEEIVFFNPELPLKTPSGRFVFPDGSSTPADPERDPREIFADWLLAPRNPWFARAIANRAWSWFFGRGIIHEADDIRPDNPPSNPELLATLEREIVASGYDLKRLFRAILTSSVYQLSSVARSEHPEAEASFAFYAPRRLDAEVLIDALNQISGTTEKYSSAIPEPFTFIPEDQRSVSLPDGSITSAFLETFGRPGRDTGLESERNNRINPAQRLHLLNSTHIRRKIEQGPKLQPLLRSRGGPREIVDNIYYTLLSRPPTDRERQVAAAYAQTPGIDARSAVLDLIWALVNSAEFLHRH